MGILWWAVMGLLIWRIILTIDRIHEISRAKKAWIEAERDREFQEWRRTGIIPERISNGWRKKKVDPAKKGSKKESYMDSDYSYSSYSSSFAAPEQEQEKYENGSKEDNSPYEFDFRPKIYVNGISIDPSEYPADYSSPGNPTAIYAAHGTYRKDENGNWSLL